MATVKFANETNSTFFTTCCEVAICDDQATCPLCGEEVEPRSKRGRWDVAMYAMYGRKQVNEWHREWRRETLMNWPKKRNQQKPK